MPLLTELGGKSPPIYKHCAPNGADELLRNARTNWSANRSNHCGNVNPPEVVSHHVHIIRRPPLVFTFVSLFCVSDPGEGRTLGLIDATAVTRAMTAGKCFRSVCDCVYGKANWQAVRYRELLRPGVCSEGVFDNARSLPLPVPNRLPFRTQI